MDRATWEHSEGCKASGPGFCAFCGRVIDASPTQIPTTPKRFETGPIIINKDYPGVFIRGEQALYFAFALEHFLESYYDNIGGANTREAKIMLNVLESLEQTLKSCHINVCKDAKQLFVNSP